MLKLNDKMIKMNLLKNSSNDNNLKFIVTGTGRCGTVFAARFLTSLGIPCGHESIFNHSSTGIKERIVNPNKRFISECSTNDFVDGKRQSLPKWVIPSETQAESSYMAAPYLNMEEILNIPLIHIVRNPIKVVSSFIFTLNYFNKSIPTDPWQVRIYETLPELREIDTQIERACYYYCKWNNLIESYSNSRPYLKINIENINSNVFFDFVKLKPTKPLFNDKKANRIVLNKKYLKLSEIPLGYVKDMFVKQNKFFN